MHHVTYSGLNENQIVVESKWCDMIFDCLVNNSIGNESGRPHFSCAYEGAFNVFVHHARVWKLLIYLRNIYLF